MDIGLYIDKFKELRVEAVLPPANINNQNQSVNQLKKEEEQNQGFAAILGTEVEKLKEAEERVKTK